MACRCQERREALRRAASSRTMAGLRKEVAFVGRTMAEDAGRALLRRGKPKDKKR